MKFFKPDLPHIGIVVPLSAIRSEASPACGEYPDLSLLGDLASKWKFNLIQLLPVNDTGRMSSPYSALSAFALHPLYLRVSDLPEAKDHPDFIKEARSLAIAHAGDSRLDYHAMLEGKLAILEKLFLVAWGSRRDRALDKDAAFNAWLAANPWSKAYAVFSELKRREAGRPWWEWKAHRDPGQGGVADLWADPSLTQGSNFRAWLQWRAEEQLTIAARDLAQRGIELLGDIPILIGKDSADVWANRDVFNLGFTAGSPPDGENPLGQNWGFPLYNWGELRGRDFDFWKDRLASAAKFYSSYRIDHVLGFFRIWANGDREGSGFLGHFEPAIPIGRDDLLGLGFDEGRLRWLSEPHLPLGFLHGATDGDEDEVAKVVEFLLDRIGSEELFLFKRSIRGELDIQAVCRASGLRNELCETIIAAWRDRVLIAYGEKGEAFTAAWGRHGTTAWASLSDSEKADLESLFVKKEGISALAWEQAGESILGELAASCDMLPSAEDLGAIPPYVPRVLERLGILGLRVFRWTRKWDQQGQPFVPLHEWPRLSVACPSVHDSSSLRQWWESEADRPLVWSLAAAALGRGLGPAPARLDREGVSILLELVARANSLIAVFPIQDLLGLSSKYGTGDPALERVNIPGTDTRWNWGYRVPAALEEISADEELAEAARSLALLRNGK